MKTETRIRRATEKMETEIMSTLRLIVLIMLQNDYSDEWWPMMSSWFDLKAQLAAYDDRTLNIYAGYMNILADQWMQRKPISAWLVDLDLDISYFPRVEERSR